MGDDIRLISMKRYGAHELQFAKGIEYSVGGFVEAAASSNRAVVAV